MAGATRVALLLLLAILLLASPGPAAALFGRKKKDPAEVEAKARAALEESMKADAAKKGGEPAAPPKPKAKAGVTARKLVKDTEVVEGQNFTIYYDVHNAGPLSANVLVDDSANLAGLRILDGDAKMDFGEIQPFTRLRTPVVVVADSERVIPASRATVTWTVTDPDTNEEISETGESTVNPPIEVFTWTNYRRAKKMYFKEYGLFFLGVLPPVLLPLLVWLALAATNEKRYGKKKRR